MSPRKTEINCPDMELRLKTNRPTGVRPSEGVGEGHSLWKALTGHHDENHNVGSDPNPATL